MGTQRLAEAIDMVLADPTINSKVLFIDCKLELMYKEQPFSGAIKNWANRGQRMIIAPAGNGNQSLKGPDDKSVLTVGAVNLDDTKASYSNYGSQVDLWAPGHSYVTTTTGTGYAVTDSTSVAAAHVVGIVGLILAIRPNLTGVQLRDILIDSADATDVGPRVNAERALQVALTL